jgi:hypothetical protein
MTKRVYGTNHDDMFSVRGNTDVISGRAGDDTVHWNFWNFGDGDDEFVFRGGKGHDTFVLDHFDPNHHSLKFVDIHNGVSIVFDDGRTVELHGVEDIYIADNYEHHAGHFHPNEDSHHLL